MGIRRWYIPLVLLLITVFVPWFVELGRVNDLVTEARIKAAPVYTIEQIRTEMQWVREHEHEWDVPAEEGKTISANTPQQYWEFLERRTKLEDATARYTRPNNAFNPEVDARAKSLGTFAPTLRIKYQFERKFGHDVLFRARPKDPYFDRRYHTGDIQSDAWKCFMRAFLLSIPIMFLVFCIRLRVRGLMIWVELWRLIPASMTWPVAAFIYPMSVRRKEQLKLALNVWSYAMSALVSICGGGAMVPLKAQVGPTGGKSVAGKRSDEKRFSSGYGVELYPTTTGIDAGKMISPWYSYKWSVGKGFTVSGFHFVEAGERYAQLFTNHGTTVTNQSFRGAMFTTEVGATPAGLFVQLCPRVNLTKVPFVGRQIAKAAKSVVVGRGWRVRGPTHFQENYLFWASRDLKLFGGLSVATEGFMRFRVGGLPAVGEPQVLFRHKKLKHIDFVTEFWMIRTDPTVRLGFQLHK